MDALECLVDLTVVVIIESIADLGNNTHWQISANRIRAIGFAVAIFVALRVAVLEGDTGTLGARG